MNRRRNVRRDFDVNLLVSSRKDGLLVMSLMIIF